MLATACIRFVHLLREIRLCRHASSWTVTFSPTDLAGLLPVDLPGDVSWDELVTGTTIIELYTALTGPATRFRATSRLPGSATTGHK